MFKGRRKPRYERVAQAQEREAGVEREIWLRQHGAMLAAADQERQRAKREDWAAVDPALRLWRVRPDEVSQLDGITREVVRRFEQIKFETLGYQEGTLRTPDEDRFLLSEAARGSVAGQMDAERLATALAAEFPSVAFRIEMQEVLLEDVVWQNIAEVADA